MKTKKILSILLTAIMLLSFAACGGIGTSEKITATLNSIYEDGGLKDYYISDYDWFISTAQNEYGMSEETARSLISNPDSWQVYSLDIEIENKNEAPFTFVRFAPIESTVEGFYFCTLSINAEFTIAGGITDSFPANIIVDTSVLSTEQMYSTVASLEIDILSYATPKDENDEVKEEDYETIRVHNNIVAPENDTAAPESELSAKQSSVTDGSAFLKLYRENELIFSNEAKLYGMDSETAAQAMNKKGNWECYVFNIEVENKTDDDMTVYNIISENNGKNGIWVNSVSQYGEFSMEAGAKEEMPVTILVDTDALNGKAIEKALSELNISLEYSKGTLIDEYGNESIQIKKTVEVK